MSSEQQPPDSDWKWSVSGGNYPQQPRPKNQEVIGCLWIAGIIGFVLFISAIASFFDAQHKRELERAPLDNQHGVTAGDLDGYNEAFGRAEEQAYNRTIHELEAEGKCNRVPAYDILIFCAWFGVGFLIQYAASYLLRKFDLLHDVDTIVLPDSLKRITAALLVALSLVSLTGCGDSIAYRDGYEQGKQGGYDRGSKEGERQGVIDAKRDGEAGIAWRIYRTPMTVGLIFGLVLGVGFQFILLICCHDASRVAQFPITTFVPGVKSSFCYSIIARKRRIMVDLDLELDRMEAMKTQQVAQIETVREVIHQKIRAAQTIDELSQSRFVDLANQEFAKIIANADALIRPRTKKPFRCICPHCGGTIAFAEQAASKVIKCPHVQCRADVLLPSPNLPSFPKQRSEP